MKKELTNFLDNLTIAKKSIILIIVMTLGTLLIGGIAHYGLDKMRSNYSSYYANYYKPMNKLETIREFYIQKIKSSIQKGDYKKIEDYKNLGYSEWNNLLEEYYKNIDTNKDGFQKLIDDIQNELVKVNNISSKLNDSNSEKLESELNRLDQKISLLLNYYYDKIKGSFQSNNSIFSNTEFMVIAITILVALLTFLLSLMVYKNFIKILTNLANVVEQRDRENQELERSLTKRVDEAVKESRKKDQVIYQKARLASMGEMIGNIAHQWRQPLNALTLLIQSFETKSMTGNLTKEFIDKQVKEGLRLAESMSDTIEDFRNFFSTNREKEYFSIQEAIRNTLEMSTFFLKDENISIRIILYKQDLNIYGYANEFSQVILNLINNSRDNFKIKKLKDKRIEISIDSNDEHIILTFIDNGGGIDEDIIDRIFEPYFTTKHKSIGTGIGLYMSKQIIETQMRGTIEVENVDHKFDDQEFKSAKFIIKLPK